MNEIGDRSNDGTTVANGIREFKRPIGRKTISPTTGANANDDIYGDVEWGKQ